MKLIKIYIINYLLRLRSMAWLEIRQGIQHRREVNLESILKIIKQYVPRHAENNPIFILPVTYIQPMNVNFCTNKTD